MVEDYIIKQLGENDEKIERLKKRLLQLEADEDSCKSMITKLLENEDVGMEIFSPRRFEDSTREKVSRIKKQIAEIRVEQAEISEKISKAKENEENYQNMLTELCQKREEEERGLEILPSEQDSSAGNPEESTCKIEDREEKAEEGNWEEKEELKEVLGRIEKCLNLLYTDKRQCKHELTNLKYYLKALITRK